APPLQALAAECACTQNARAPALRATEKSGGAGSRRPLAVGKLVTDAHSGWRFKAGRLACARPPVRCPPVREPTPDCRHADAGSRNPAAFRRVDLARAVKSSVAIMSLAKLGW